VNVRYVLIVLAIAVECLLLRLGFWQLARGAEKQTQSEALQTVLSEKKPIDLSTASSQSKAYQWARGNIRFQADTQLLLDNQRRDNKVGVVVYQLGISDSGQAFLIDLGWLPVNDVRQFPKPEAVRGAYTLEGLLLPPPSPGFSIGPALSEMDSSRLLLTRLEMTNIATHLKQPLAVRVLRPDPIINMGYKRDLDVLQNTLPPEKHSAYALQWFALAAAWIVLCVYVQRRKKV
jgi:surfeit locus 1 family protein